MQQRFLFQGLKLDRRDELILHAFVLDQTMLHKICNYFKCTACCEVQDSISVFASDIRNIKRYLGKKSLKNLFILKKGVWSIKNVKPCQFLKDNLCSIYKVRPEVCYGFPFINSKYYRIVGDPNQCLSCRLTLISALYCFASLIFHKIISNITPVDLLIDTSDKEACSRFAMEKVEPYLNRSMVEELRKEFEQKWEGFTGTIFEL